MPQPVGYPAEVREYRQSVKDFGTCLNFSSSGEVTLGTANPFTGNFYFSAWVKWAGPNGNLQHLFAKRDSYGASTMMFDLYLDSSTNVLGIDTNAAQRSFSYKLQVGKWTHVLWVHNVTDSLDQLYINGDQVSSQSLATLGTGTSALLTIGAVQFPASESFNGLIDEVAIGTAYMGWSDAVAAFAKYVYPSSWTTLSFDETSGTTAIDSSGNGNSGTIASATYVTDKVITSRVVSGPRFVLPTTTQKSLSMNGTSDFVTVPFVPDTNGFCFSIWVNIQALTTNKAIFDCTTASNTDGFKLIVNNALTFAIYNGVSNTVSINAGQQIPNKWVHILATFKPNEAKLFVNGSQVSATDTSCVMSTPGTFRLGKSLTFTSTCFSGQVKNFIFQNTSVPWTAQQIQDIYYKNIAPSGASLFGFNDVSTDQFGTNTLTLSGCSYSTNVPFPLRTSV